MRVNINNQVRLKFVLPPTKVGNKFNYFSDAEYLKRIISGKGMFMIYYYVTVKGKAFPLLHVISLFYEAIRHTPMNCHFRKDLAQFIIVNQTHLSDVSADSHQSAQTFPFRLPNAMNTKERSH